MKTWMPDKGFGFVTDASGEDFYFSRKSLVYPEDEKLLTQPNAQLAFRTAEAVRSRRAVTALVIGGEGEGRITYVSPNPDRRFGFITVTDDFGSECVVSPKDPPDTKTARRDHRCRRAMIVPNETTRTTVPAALSANDRSGGDRATGVDRTTAARGSPQAEP